MHPRTSRALVVLALISALVPPLYADRTQLKPGWNLFSPQQDVEMGRQVAQEAESQLAILRNRRASAYIDSLGKQLASRAPGEKYPYQFKIVNDSSINAFALPGGFIYINRGTIEAASTEAELAGVVAHEIGHVALRHGTNQASKAYAAQVPLAILGGVVGSNSIGGVLTQLGIGFATNSILLKYSRDAERQADILGTQMLYDSGYDPRAMVNFFEKLQAQSGGRAADFFSSHPNPENRIQGVQGEIQKIGGLPRNARNDSPDFQEVKKIMLSMSPAPKAGAATADNSSGRSNGRPANPSNRMVNFEGREFRFRHPDNWRAYGEGDAVTLAPNGGIVSNSLAWGTIISSFEPRTDRNGRVTLEDATNQLVNDLRRSNPGMRTVRNPARVRVAGQRGLSTELTNDSPIGGRETDWVVTVLSQDGLLYYFVGVAPQRDFSQYERAFQSVIDSFRFN